jgi:PPM family protein phosphatase
MINSENDFKWKVDASFATDIGCRSEHNEDRLLFFEPDDPLILKKKGIFAIVADGMGGHRAGEIASELAVKLVKQNYYSNDSQELPLALVAAFEAANRTIYQLSVNNKAYQGMGTTCTALVLHQGKAYCAHIGDSRLYLLRDERLLQLTEDHSVVMGMVKAGIISAEEAQHHPDRHVISQALGINSQVEISSWDTPLSVREGDLFLLCSDGLYDLVENEEMKKIIRSQNLTSACEKLIAIAKERGGYDNISVVLLHIRGDRIRGSE